MGWISICRVKAGKGDEMPGEHSQDAFARGLESLSAFARDMGSFVQEVSAAQRRWKPIFDDLRGRLAAFPQETRDLQTYLIPRGWYLTMRASIALVRSLATAVRAEQHEVVEEAMRGYARYRFDTVGLRVDTLWPERSYLIREALAAHSAGKYALSIPVLLAQAEGISNELLGVSVFGKHRGGPATASAHRQHLSEPCLDPNSFKATVLLGPLEVLSGLAMGVSDHEELRARAEPTFGTLNRHAVAHGISLDYGTEENSLRAVLLLDFLADLKRGLVVSEAE
jgi:hypothetical protein